MKNLLLLFLLVCSHLLAAQTNLDSLEILLKTDPENTEFLNQLAHSYWKVSPEKGLTYAKKAYAIALKENSKMSMAKALKTIGINYWAQSEFYPALENFKKSLLIFRELKDQEGISALLSNIGVVHKELSDYENAMKYYMESLEISEKYNYTELYTKIIGNISDVHYLQKNYLEAYKYIQEAIDLSIKHNDTNNLMYNLTSLGSIYEAQGNLNEAKSSYERALHLYKKANDNYGTTVCLYNIGNTAYRLKHYDSALAYFQASLELSEKINDQIGIVLVYKSIGLINKEQNQLKTAQSNYSKSFKLAMQLGLRQEKMDLYKNFADLYRSMGKLDKSIEYLDKFLLLKDSIYNENSAKQIAEIQAKYDSEKKEKENVLLRKNAEIQKLAIAKQTNLRNTFMGVSILVILLIFILWNRFTVKKKANLTLISKNEIIAAQRDELELINTTKNKFFSIISHDLRGPVNNIIELTNILLDDYNSIDDVQKIKLFGLLNKSSQSTYDLLDNLLNWAQAQSGCIQILNERLNVKELVETSITPYANSASRKNIEILSNVPSNAKINVDRFTTKTIIGNLVSNAIKFTPMGGTITINYLDNEDSFELHIIDTGVGMTKEVMEKLFRLEDKITTKGTNNEYGTGLGLTLCKELINLNDGAITVRSEVGIGSVFIITFPIKKSTDLLYIREQTAIMA